ncbi:phosphatase PAP2 family protein [Miniphocaeibacter massiliensis]|uniref:phosphatase PAP2 family protein n=1 Tax=Miniphocaeibacter massiliensis TaxID=2041841 RepID=UPI000C081722|nr:phosphatase PAP2 family protein [Miniphocaeibacter massiliensis]
MIDFFTLMIITIIVFFAIFLFGIIIYKKGGFKIDYRVREIFYNYNLEYLKKIMNKITEFANIEVISMISVPILFYLIHEKQYIEATTIIFSIMFSFISSQLLKVVFRIKRPTESQKYSHIGYSFPSGHSSVGMSFYLTLSFILIKSIEGSMAILALAVLFGITIGISRLVLGVHWFTDVVIGLALGLLCSFWSMYFYNIGYYFKLLFN